MLRLPEHLQPEQYGHLEKGDKILEINGVPIKNQDQSEVGRYLRYSSCVSSDYACMFARTRPTDSCWYLISYTFVYQKVDMKYNDSGYGIVVCN